MAADPDQHRSQQIGHTVAEIAEKAQVLVREEIELAKAEVTQKATKLGKGAATLAVAGTFGVLGLIFFLHTLSWFFYWLLPFDDIFWGFLLTTIILFVAAGIAALIGIRWVKKGSPPTPDMAIEEARRIQETVKS